MPVRKRNVVAGTVLSAVACACIAVLIFGLLAYCFPWLRPSSDPATTAAATTEPIQRRIVGRGTPSPAEQALDAIDAKPLPAFDGWEQRASSEVPTTSLTFGCEPINGVSPVLARTRSFVSEAGQGSTSVRITARAYPAGGGAVALDGIRLSALACDGSDLQAAPLALGVEAIAVTSNHTASLVWRRGDVVITALSETAGQPGSITAFAAPFGAVDDALADALDGACVAPDAGVDASTRSPYLDRNRYEGSFVDVLVAPQRKNARRAEKTSNYPVVPIPPDQPAIPAVGSVPVKPDPAPTSGPTLLPPVVAMPDAPAVPTEPALSSAVPQQVVDVEGPGCGWAFTGQAVPAIDEEKANAQFESKFADAREILTRRWVAWQRAKAAFYKSWYRYQGDLADYRDYATAVAAVRVAWERIQTARDAYLAALTTWNAQNDAQRAYAAAQDAYLAALEACAQQPTASPTPTTSAGTKSPNPTSGATPSPSASPTGSGGRTCPPAKPAILLGPSPTVGASPVPDPAAQLPSR